MRYSKADTTWVIKLEKGEEVVQSLTEFCISEHIQNGVLSGIGAVDVLKCGYYALSEKKYYFTEYTELVEVASLSGNIMLKEGIPFIHMHGVFTDTKNNAFGGHVAEMRVGVVLEVILTPLSSVITRIYDESIGLYLMNCGEV